MSFWQLDTMVWKYRRQTNQQSWGEDAMKKAIIDVVENSLSYEKAATRYGVSSATLWRRVKSYKESGSMEVAVKKGEYAIISHMIFDVRHVDVHISGHF